MKLVTRCFPAGNRQSLLSLPAKILILPFLLLSVAGLAQNKIPVSGIVVDSAGKGISGVTVTEKGTKNIIVTADNGAFSINVAGTNSVLNFTYVGFGTKEVRIGNQTQLNVSLEQANADLGEVVVVGYGSRKKESLTGAISTVTSKDLERVHGGATVSSGLAGKLPGVTFRMPDGRPGASASIQIRNMGDPLYVIDGIQQDAGQFNNLAPNDVESITILKDASAAIYGVRAANGVVVVTTKRGRTGTRNTINIDAYTGWQNWSRFPKTVNAYEWQLGVLEADMNRVNPSTNMTKEELAKWKQGTEYGYRSFDWYDFIVKGNSPLTSMNVNATGGSERINYYLSVTRLDQNSVLGREFTFKRTNVQSNIDARITNRFKVGMQINGRVETRDNPGVPGEMITGRLVLPYSATALMNGLLPMITRNTSTILVTMRKTGACSIKPNRVIGTRTGG
ncbi:TonB-dependent receptor plug domain-containing protein [Paraflavitalea speifideaquila]|uniref:TonB-dependent receptor plug domain-containing protein n=1 Tax=Paraflavitalea speifideaquila TaxID=3076558 RepID=UPI0028E8E795|nr:TonB-dependent receptor plug domain-containing protein [Paraflavitalea speifideiaquila]